LAVTTPKLSIMMPSHNVGTRTNINILNASLMGNDDVEVVIRDNSGNAEKRDFLSRIKENNCRIMSVDECPGRENFISLLNEVKGDFTFFVCDDDYANGYCLSSIVKRIKKIESFPDFIGIAGGALIDHDNGTDAVLFSGLHKRRNLTRVENLFKSNWPSVFQYSAMRTDILRTVWAFSETLPVYMSYHDMLMNSLALLHGRVVTIKRFFYQYYNSNWATHEQHLESDAGFFRRMGIDPSGVRLQWLIAAFEGARTFIEKYHSAPLSQEERGALASYWFGRFFQTFLERSTNREAEGARFDKIAFDLSVKWRWRSQISLDEILNDIVDFYALSSPEIASAYYEFWK
jgi:hypothetical protein